MGNTKQNGFTLIELLLVIVILSILAVIAIPRFVDLQREAQVSVIEGVQGALKSTSAIFHAQALVDDVSVGNITIDGESFPIVEGYIQGFWNGAWRQALNLSGTVDFTPVGDVCEDYVLCGVGLQSSLAGAGLPISTGGVSGLVLVWPKGYLLTDQCYAFYFNPETGDAPSIGSVTTGC